MPPVAAGFLGIEHFAPPWDVLFLPFFNLLIGLYQVIFNDFALAIILFTVIIRSLLAPLFVRQIRSQKEMQRMQPLVREVQRKHKGNRQKISEETMALYREHGVNPAAGCLPLLVQLPLLVVLWNALTRASNVVTISAEAAASDAFRSLREALPGIQAVAGSTTQFNAPVSGPCNLPQFSGEFGSFIPLNCQLIDPLKLSAPLDTTVSWLFNLDLSKIDAVFSVGAFGFVISGLAILAGVLQFVQVKMTAPSGAAAADDPTAATTQTMTYLFPIMTVFWGGFFPSGLMLYWIVLTAYIIVHQYVILGWGNLFPIFGWQPRFAGSPAGGASSPPPRPPQAGAGTATRQLAPQPISRSGGSPAPTSSRPRPPRNKRRGRKR